MANTSIKDYVENVHYKDMITQILRAAYTNIEEDEFEEITELINNKLAYMVEYKKTLAAESEESLRESAEMHGTSPDNILDAFIYFTLIVDNVIMQEELRRYEEKDDEN